MENSSYDLVRQKYTALELDEEGNLVEPENAADTERYGDQKVNDKSLIQLAGKETLYILKSLYQAKRREVDPPSVSPLQVHVAAIRIAARLSHSREKEETDTEREREKKERMGGEIINDGHRHRRAKRKTETKRIFNENGKH